jgi:hypothetical protein
MRKLHKLAAAVAIALLAAGPARAVTYQYVSGTYNVYALGGYSSSDFITGTFEIATALSANLTINIDLAGSITSFSFSDGLQTISSSTPGAYVQYFNGFKTDAAGNITTWNVDVRVSGPYGYSNIYSSYPSAYGLHGGCLSATSFCSSEARGSDSGGYWVLVPEPARLALALPALLLGITLRRRG